MAADGRLTLGRGLNRANRNSHYGELEESQECVSELVVSGGDATELLELVEEALDKVSLTIERLFPAESPLAPAHVGNVGDRTASLDVSSDAVRIVGLVGNDDGAPLEVGQERFDGRQIVRLTGRDEDLDRPALTIDAGVDLGREPSAAAPHTTISTLFFTPEAC